LTKGKKKIAGHYYKEEMLVNWNNRQRTQSLFYETRSQNHKIKPLFTLSYDENIVKHGYTFIPMKRLYLECNDPTEALFVEKYLLDWKHWKKMLAADRLRVHIDRWREELALRIRSRAIQIQIELAENGNQNAAKWLANEGWKQKVKDKPAPKPTKVKSALKEKKDKELENFMVDDARSVGIAIQ